MSWALLSLAIVLLIFASLAYAFRSKHESFHDINIDVIQDTELGEVEVYFLRNSDEGAWFCVQSVQEIDGHQCTFSKDFIGSPKEGAQIAIDDLRPFVRLARDPEQKKAFRNSIRQQTELIAVLNPDIAVTEATIADHAHLFCVNVLQDQAHFLYKLDYASNTLSITTNADGAIEFAGIRS